MRTEPSEPVTHPREELLVRFVRGEASREESREAVRHLLAGCPECLQRTRRLWRLGDRPPREEKSMTEAEATAQDQLRAIAADLKAIRFHLQEVKAALPRSSEETAMLEGEVDMDVSTELQSVIECVLNDSIDPAIRSLLAAADYAPGSPRSIVR
jgi:hypothetical protein